MNCHACGTPLSPAARFCHKCGARVGQDHTHGWRAGLPWAIAGLSVGALVTIVVVRLSGASGGGGGVGGGGGGGPVTPGSPPGGMRAPDISQMSPQERADRLFERVMMLSEAGRTDSVRFFLPMALQAHAMLPELSTDTRFHIALLHLAGENPTSALAQADTILRATPTHLFGFILRARALEQRNDGAGARRAYGDFLRNEIGERARERPEYADHKTTLDQIHEDARQRAGR
jgi:hypothetical protein